MKTLRTLIYLVALAIAAPLFGQQIVGNLTVQQYVRNADGTAAAPSYRFTTEPDTGFFLSAANAIGVSTAGVERWTFNASGSLNPLVNNTYDIGNGTVNPRDVYVARNLTVSSLTSGRIPVAGASGLLADDADLTFATDTLTATKGVIGGISSIANAITNANSMTSVAGTALSFGTGTSGTALSFASATNVASLTAVLESSAVLRSTGGTVTGAGGLAAEIGVFGGTPTVVAYNRTGATYGTLALDGSTVQVKNSGSLALTISGGVSAVLTGGAGNTTLIAGTGASRTLTIQTTTSGGTATNALVIDATQKINATSGVLPDGGGFKHARVTTGSVSAGSTALITVTWGTTFADANYTVSASVVDSTTSSLALSVVHVESISASAVTVRVLNNAVGSLTGTVHVIAIHD